jgi:hypothetical protein
MSKITYKDVEIETVNVDDNIYFIHPQIGQLCENVEQTFFGWSFQNDELNKDYEILIERILRNKCDVWLYITNDVDYEYK